MIFTRIIYSAILVGMVAGALLTALQITRLEPILLGAEAYEAVGSDAGAKADHDHGEHDREPAGGPGRSANSFLANLLACSGFAAVMLALMCQFRLPRRRRMAWSEGMLWGLAGYTVMFVAPAIGLPPEIPGMISAPLEQRQIWWVASAFSVAAGLSVVAFAPVRFRLLGLPLLALPYLIGAPVVDGPLFRHTDSAALEALTELHQRFVVASAIVNLVVWLVLGLACRVAFNRCRPLAAEPGDDARA